MKRIIAVCLVIMFMLSLALVVYGEGENNSSLVTYTVYDSYDFDIPTTVNLNINKIYVRIYNKITNDPVHISLTSSSCTETDHFMLVHENNPNSELEYQLLYGEDVIGNGIPFVTFKNDGVAELDFRLISSGPFYAGNYTDTITFHFG